MDEAEMDDEFLDYITNTKKININFDLEKVKSEQGDKYILDLLINKKIINNQEELNNLFESFKKERENEKYEIWANYVFPALVKNEMIDDE
jgi:hypothetical protein